MRRMRGKLLAERVRAGCARHLGCTSCRGCYAVTRTALLTAPKHPTSPAPCERSRVRGSRDGGAHIAPTRLVLDLHCLPPACPPCVRRRPQDASKGAALDAAEDGSIVWVRHELERGRRRERELCSRGDMRRVRAASGPDGQSPFGPGLRHLQVSCQYIIVLHTEHRLQSRVGQARATAGGGTRGRRRWSRVHGGRLTSLSPCEQQPEPPAPKPFGRRWRVSYVVLARKRRPFQNDENTPLC